MYTDDCGCFSIRKRIGNKYITIAFNCDTNTILNAPFKTQSDTHHIAAYNSIMQRLTTRGHNVDLQVIENEVSASYKKAITETWKARYQLVPPHFHFRNAAEKKGRTFQSHFLSILAGVNTSFSGYLWDTILLQT